MKKFFLRRSVPLPPLLDWCLLLLLLAACTPAILFRHRALFIAPPLDLLDGSWLLDTSYKAATGIWFGRDVTFTYGPLFQWLSSAPSRWLGISGTLREWLEHVPEKVMFATDAYPFSSELGWEESGWISAHNGREALGRALTAMLRDGVITHTRAVELARMVLRENARGLYGF